MSELAYAATKALLQQAKEEKESKQALWQFIYENWREMKEAHDAGLKFKTIAQSLGVSSTSFHLAKKKALSKMEAEAKKAQAAQAQKEKQEALEEQKAQAALEAQEAREAQAASGVGNGLSLTMKERLEQMTNKYN